MVGLWYVDDVRSGGRKVWDIMRKEGVCYVDRQNSTVLIFFVSKMAPMSHC